MNRYDRIMERVARSLARGVSRRNVLRSVGALLVSGASLPLLPVARGQNRTTAATDGDTTSCEYWRYCAIDGFLCSCCGGSVTTCPPGTLPAPVTWVGTCRHATDGKDYIVSYNDCCGKGGCGRCRCARAERDKPTYIPFQSNDYDWCVGSKADIPYHCTVSRIVGLAQKSQ
jgi:methylamine dehydrogenase light chain